MEFKVMTFNLRIDSANDGENAWKYRTDRAASVIKDASPSIIGTQEGVAYMLKDLESRLDGYEWVGKGRHGGMNGETTAIFIKKSEFSIKDHGTFWLSETPDVPDSQSWDTAYTRICTWCRVGSVRQPGQFFAIYNLHLDNISDEARVHGIQLVSSVIHEHQTMNKLPFILTGDFNSGPEGRAILYLREKTATEANSVTFKDAYVELGMKNEDIGHTCHKYKGGTDGVPIDYIFVSPGLKVLKLDIDRRLINGGYPSDHYPVTAAIEYSE